MIFVYFVRRKNFKFRPVRSKAWRIAKRFLTIAASVAKLLLVAIVHACMTTVQMHCRAATQKMVLMHVGFFVDCSLKMRSTLSSSLTLLKSDFHIKHWTQAKRYKINYMKAMPIVLSFFMHLHTATLSFFLKEPWS